MNKQNRMAKDSIYKLLDGTDYMKNPDKLDEYRDTKNKMFGAFKKRRIRNNRYK